MTVYDCIYELSIAVLEPVPIFHTHDTSIFSIRHIIKLGCTEKILRRSRSLSKSSFYLFSRHILVGILV